MIDIKLLRTDKKKIVELLSRRKNEKFNLDKIAKLDNERRDLLLVMEQKKYNQKTFTKTISKIKEDGKDACELIKEMKRLSEEIKGLEGKIKLVEIEIESEMLCVPNIPDELVPDGETDDDNVEIRRFNQPPQFDFDPLSHWELGEIHDLFNPKIAAKTTGSRFVFYTGLGAKLERSIINFFLDVHTKNGYKEVFPPFIVNRDSMTGVGQLPKFEDAAFKIVDTNYFLVPTAEVPITNMYKDHVFGEEELPIKHVAYSACFRSEAGSAGRDTRGLIRQHQFNKVELVKFVKPEDSYNELDSLVNDVENVLKLLNLPYRVVKMCIGDLGFQASLKYDVEVWMPSYNKYVEISSCSLFKDFQSRRINIKFRDKLEKKTRLVYTINGSGLAVGRTYAAILENFQNRDKSIDIPSALQKYFESAKI